MRIAKNSSTSVALAMIGLLLLLVSILGGCTHRASNSLSTPLQTPAAQDETPVAPEKNPPGDIPDTQVFVQYRSTQGGYQLDVPEGWARTAQGANVDFIDKLDGVKVVITQAASAPTAASARTNEVTVLEKSGRAVQVSRVQDVRLPAGAAVLVEYSSNSDPDPVTGKQVRLENQMYLFFQNDHMASLTLWAPYGADNVDQWQRMSQSFRWS